MPTFFSELVSGVRRYEFAFDLIRIYLGIGLFARGVVFIAQPSAFYGLLDVADPAFFSAVLAHYVALAHLAGGILLAAGLLTRLAALVQIPILAGAVFFVHLSEGLAAPGQGLEFAALVLVLLLAYAAYGAGPFSLDELIFRSEGEETPRPYRIEERPMLEGEVAPGVPADVGLTPAVDRCRHGYDRDHAKVLVERRYGLGGAIRFLTGTTGRPTEIVFRCSDCGGIVETSKEPEDLAFYTYHEEKRRRRRARRDARGSGQLR